MPLAVGIDLGRRYVRAVVVDQRASTTTVTQLLEEEVLSGDTAEALKILLVRLPKQIASSFSIPLEEVIMRPVEFPFSDDEKIRETISFKMEPFLEGSIEDHLVDYYVSAIGVDTTQVLGFGLLSDYLKRYLDAAQSVGYDPQRVNVDLFSLATLFAEKYSQESNLPSAFIDIGAGGCRIAVIKDAKVCFVRSLRQGCQWLISYVAHQCDISREDAAKVCFNHEADPQAQGVRQRGL